MSPNALASKLLQLCSSTSLLAPGSLIADLGPETVQDAISRGWLRPDLESGTYLALTNQQAQLNEMRELAASPEAAASAAQQEACSRQFAMSHSRRNLVEAFGVGLAPSTSGATGAPGSGQPPRATDTQTPTMEPPNTMRDYMVGEDVVVADEGKAYQAKVQAKNQNGTYRLSFGPNRPTTQDRDFRREEMQKVTSGDKDMVRVQQ